MSLQGYHCSRNNASVVTKQKSPDSCKDSQKVNIAKNKQNTEHDTEMIAKAYNGVKYDQNVKNILKKQDTKTWKTKALKFYQQRTDVSVN